MGLRKCPPGGFCDVRGPKLHPQSMLSTCRDLVLVMPGQDNHHTFSSRLSPHSPFLLLYSLPCNYSEPIAFGEADLRPLPSPCLTTLQIYPLFAANFGMSGLWQSETSSVNSSVQLLSCVQLFAIPCTAAHQASLSITNSRSLLKLMSIEWVMPSNHLILCCPLLHPSIFASIKVFSNESVLHIRWPKYWSSASASVLPMNTQD